MEYDLYICQHCLRIHEEDFQLCCDCLDEMGRYVITVIENEEKVSIRILVGDIVINEITLNEYLSLFTEIENHINKKLNITEIKKESSDIVFNCDYINDWE